jgi:glyoxylase I family protein
MRDIRFYQARREELKKRYLPQGEPAAPTTAVSTGGVDHLALICSDLDATIHFYTEMLGMRLMRIVQNRDEPTSTHIFFDMGGGNLLAFFDFPEKDTSQTIRGIGSMHHVALKATRDSFQKTLATLEAKGIQYSLHGSREAGSVYLRDPDDILLEITTGY